jgi:hypothetical protein
MKITDKQYEKIHRLYTRLWKIEAMKKPTSLDDVLSNIPDGDFEWDDNEAGDWHVWNCGERDCPIQWHKISYALDIARRDGKLTIERHSCDEDGNWDLDCAWEEGEDWEEMGYALASESYNYFKGWAEYWLECAQTGKDPLEESTGVFEEENIVDFFINCAEEEIKYLEYPIEETW